MTRIDEAQLMVPVAKWESLHTSAAIMTKEYKEAKAKLAALQEAITIFLGDFQIPDEDEKWGDYLDLKAALAKSKE